MSNDRRVSSIRIDPIFKLKTPILFAHRGGVLEAPESTEKAFRHALDVARAEVLEMDVQLTRDGRFVVWHGPDLNNVLIAGVDDWPARRERKKIYHEHLHCGDDGVETRAACLQDSLPGTQRLLQSSAVGGFPFGREFGGRDVPGASVDGDRWQVIPSRQVGRRKRTYQSGAPRIISGPARSPAEPGNASAHWLISTEFPDPMRNHRKIKTLLVANRGEISIRVMRAAHELGIKTVSIYSQEDRFSLHRMKADEAYLVGEGKGPVEAYLGIDDIVRVALECGADAIHPGYGFLSENPQFAEACATSGITFIGPSAETIRMGGDKSKARQVMKRRGVPVVPDSEGPVITEEAALKTARKIGFPVIIARRAFA